MYIYPDEESDAAGDAVPPRYSVSRLPPTVASSDIGPSDVTGTVGATIAVQDSCFYGVQSRLLMEGGPLSPRPQVEETGKRQFRAKELIDELEAINSQIHRMMSQVEQAVARFATGS